MCDERCAVRCRWFRYVLLVSVYACVSVMCVSVMPVCACPYMSVLICLPCVSQVLICPSSPCAYVSCPTVTLSFVLMSYSHIVLCTHVLQSHCPLYSCYSPACAARMLHAGSNAGAHAPCLRMSFPLAQTLEPSPSRVSSVGFRV